MLLCITFCVDKMLSNAFVEMTLSPSWPGEKSTTRNFTTRSPFVPHHHTQCCKNDLVIPFHCPHSFRKTCIAKRPTWSYPLAFYPHVLIMSQNLSNLFFASFVYVFLSPWPCERIATASFFHHCKSPSFSLSPSCPLSPFVMQMLVSLA